VYRPIGRSAASRRPPPGAVGGLHAQAGSISPGGAATLTTDAA
jgi:hypothetical protein